MRFTKPTGIQSHIGLLVFLLGLSPLLPAQISYAPAEFAEAATIAQVDSILGLMTMDEKLAQIVGTRLREIMVDGKVSWEKCREHIPHGIGHFCQ
ncbi:MAG: hypothetical protein AAF804_16055, partial [Bacteroidota bacterium]